MKLLALTFTLFIFALPVHAYRTQGVQNIRNTPKTLKEAEKSGLVISAREKSIKKELAQLKKKNKSQFEEKLAAKIENPSFYQGYLNEVNVGLAQTEKAKQIAKWVLLQQIEKDWKILETTVFNNYGAKSFKSFRSKLIDQLNAAVFVPSKKGLSFEVADWGIALVLPSLTTVRWKIQFSSKYDGNELEEGADKIKIDTGKGSGSGAPSLGDFDEGEGN